MPTRHHKRGVSLTGLILGGAAVLSANTAAGMPNDTCMALAQQGTPAAYRIEGLLFFCDAPPCYNIRVTALDTGQTVDVANRFICPVDPTQEEALGEALSFPVWDPIVVRGFITDHVEFGIEMTVFVVTGPDEHTDN